MRDFSWNHRFIALLAAGLVMGGCGSPGLPVAPGALPSPTSGGMVLLTQPAGTPLPATEAPTEAETAGAPSETGPAAGDGGESVTPAIVDPPPTGSEDPRPPVIIRFTTDQTEVQPGATVTLSWESSGGDVADISAEYFPVGSDEVLNGRYDVQPNGTLAITIPDRPLRQAYFNLHVESADHLYANNSVFIHTPCSVKYFFTIPDSWRGTDYDNCPDEGSQIVTAVQQDFQNGRMIWLPPGSFGSDAPWIAALVGVGDGSYTLMFQCLWGDDWQEGEPERDPAIVPPDGMFQPVRGFGKVWRAGLQGALGWAVAPEQSYTAHIQIGDVVWSPYRDSFFYMSTADQRVAVIRCIRLADGWAYLP